MFGTILVPLDGSAQSNVALPLALAMAKSSNGSIWLLRAAHDSALPDEHSATHEAGQSIERIAGELARSGLEVHPVTREGDAAEEILHLSYDIRADLIIMRTHGRAGLERSVFGSVAEEVLRQTRIPLVLVRPGGRRISHIRKLLVPVDGYPGASVALPTAVNIARATGASIHVLQVAVPIPMLAYMAPYDCSGGAFYDSAWDDDALLAARTYVEAVAARLRGLGLSVDAEARMAPSIADAIDTAADTASADLIVMSTHARTGPARALLGSVADAVMRTAKCPVLLVKRAGSASDLQKEIPARAEPDRHV